MTAADPVSVCRSLAADGWEAIEASPAVLPARTSSGLPRRVPGDGGAVHGAAVGGIPGVEPENLDPVTAGELTWQGALIEIDGRLQIFAAAQTPATDAGGTNVLVVLVVGFPYQRGALLDDLLIPTLQVFGS